MKSPAASLPCTRPRRRAPAFHVLAWAILAFLAVPASAQSAYTVTEIGVLPGHTNGYAISINDAGQVAGYSEPTIPNMTQRGWIYKAGALSALGTLPKRGQHSTATFIHPTTGVIVGDGDTGDFRPQGMVRIGANLHNVFPNNGGNTHLLRVDTAGRIYGYFIGGKSTDWMGGVWTPNPKKAGTYTQEILGGPGMPLSFNANGQGVGYQNGGTLRQLAAFWDNAGTRPMQVLPSRPEFTSSSANAISDNGTTIVGTGHPAFSSLPLLWSRAGTTWTLRDLPVLTGDNQGSANGVNNAGVVIGTSTYGIPGTWQIEASTSVVWLQGVPREIQSLLDPVTGAGWLITGLVSVNNSGQIAANALKGGFSRAIILTPVP